MQYVRKEDVFNQDMLVKTMVLSSVNSFHLYIFIAIIFIAFSFFQNYYYKSAYSRLLRYLEVHIHVSAWPIYLFIVLYIRSVAVNYSLRLNGTRWNLCCQSFAVQYEFFHLVSFIDSTNILKNIHTTAEAADHTWNRRRLKSVVEWFFSVKRIENDIVESFSESSCSRKSRQRHMLVFGFKFRVHIQGCGSVLFNRILFDTPVSSFSTFLR